MEGPRGLGCGLFPLRLHLGAFPLPRCRTFPRRAATPRMNFLPHTNFPLPCPHHQANAPVCRLKRLVPMSITAEWGKATVQRAAHVEATIDFPLALTATLPEQGDSGIECHKEKGFCNQLLNTHLPQSVIQRCCQDLKPIHVCYQLCRSIGSDRKIFKAEEGRNTPSPRTKCYVAFSEACSLGNLPL